jgi:hypothetical protein
MMLDAMLIFAIPNIFIVFDYDGIPAGLGCFKVDGTTTQL